MAVKRFDEHTISGSVTIRGIDIPQHIVAEDWEADEILRRQNLLVDYIPNEPDSLCKVEQVDSEFQYSRRDSK